MPNKSIPKLLQEANEVKKALEKIGADSSEYDMVGGTRTSERKPYTRKAAQPD